MHQSSDNVVVVETDEEFAYNKKVKKQLAKEEAAGEFLWMDGSLKRLTITARARVCVMDARRRDDALERGGWIFHLASRVSALHWGLQPWHTRHLQSKMRRFG